MKILTIIISIITTMSSFAGSYFQRGEWRDNNVRVCFAMKKNNTIPYSGGVKKTTRWSKSKMRKVEKWVTSEYTKDRTGIHFTGFKPCTQDENSDVILYISPSNFFKTIASNVLPGTTGFATIGDALHPGWFEDYPNAKSYAWFDGNRFGKFTTLHEFGHLARLGHEHERIEATHDLSCKLDTMGSIGKPRNPDFVPYGEYDGNSIMSYCNLFRMGASLSEGDVETLRYLYLN